MATEIDKRVVEMQFDNKDFEKNCQASLTTLEKLKMALNFDGAKGLDSMAKAANKIDLSNLSKGADAVQVKFSAMQIAGMTAIQELTKGFINLGKTIWDKSFGLMSSGGMARTLKIEQANFQMKALAKNIKSVMDSEEAQAALVKDMVTAASDAVQGTAYGMDSAASVASQLMASGVTNAEKMLDNLRGIAGVAAMTGKSFDDVGHIFATVASNGRLMRQQVMQFSYAGLNVAAVLGQQLNKSEQEINELIHKGQISFEEFADAMNKAFADSATKADDTFSGVTTNIQAQIKRIGQIFTDPFVEHSIPFLKEVKAAIQRLNTVMQPLGKTFEIVFGHLMEKGAEKLKNLNLSRISGVIYGLENIFTSIFMIADTVRKAFVDLFPPKTLQQLQQASHDFESFTRMLIPSKETLEGLRQVFVLLLSPLRLVFNIVTSLWRSAVKPMFVILTKLLGAIIRLGKALDPITSKLKDWLINSDFLDSVLSVITSTIVILVNWVTELVMIIGDLIAEFAKSDVIDKFLSTLQSIGKVIGNVILIALVSIFKVIKMIVDYLNLDNLENAINAIGNAAMFVAGVIEQAILTVLNIIQGMAESSKVFKSIWNIITEIYEIVKAIVTGDDVENHLENIKNKVKELGAQLKAFADEFVNTMREIGLGKILLIAFAVGIILLVFSLKKLTDASTGLVKSLTNITESFSFLRQALMNFASYVGAFQILLGMAIVIGAVTSALVTLGSMDEKELTRAAIVLGAFMGAIMGFVIVLTLLQKTMKMDNNKAALGILVYITGLAISIYALAAAVKVLASTEMDMEKAIPVFLTLSGLMLVLAGVCVILSKFAKEVKTGALSILAFAAGMRILVSALDAMSKLDMDLVKKTLVSFITVMLAFGGAIGLAGLGGIGAGSFLGFIGAALSLLILIKAIDMLSKFDYNKMYHGLINMALVFAPIIAFMVTAALTNKLAVGSQNILKDLGKLVMSFGFLMAVVTGMIALFSAMDTAALAKGTIIFVLIGEVLNRIITSLMEPLTGGNFSNNKINLTGNALKGVQWIILSLSVLLLSLSLFIRSMGSDEALRGAIPAIVVLGVVFVGLFKVFKVLNDSAASTSTAKVSAILALTVSLLAILSAFTLLAVFMKPEDVNRFAAISAMMFLVMLGLSAVLACSSFVNKEVSKEPTNSKNGAVSVLAMTLSLIAIASAIYGVIIAIEKIAANPEILKAATPVLIALGGVVVAMIVFIAICMTNKNDRFGQTANALTGTLLGISTVIVALAGAIAIISYVSKDMEKFDVLSIMLVFTVCMMGILFISGYIIEKMKSMMYYSATLVKAGLILGGIAIGISIIAGAFTACIKALDGIPADRVWGLMLALVVPFAVLVGGIVAVLAMATKINYEYFSKEMHSIAITFLAGAGAFVLIGTAITMLAAVANTITSFNIGIVIGAWIAALVGFAAVWGAMFSFVIACKKWQFNIKDVLLLATSITIASSAFLIIASSFAILAAAANSIVFTNDLIAVLVGVGGVMVALFATMILMTKIASKSSFANWKEYLALGASITAASTAILIIAQAIKELASIKIKDRKSFTRMFDGFIDILKGFAILVGVLALVSTKVDGLNFLAIGVTFPLVASSLLIIAGALVIMTHAVKTLTVDDLLGLALVISAMTLVFIALAGIGGIVAAVAPGIADAIIKIMLAFGAFSLAVLAFAAATDLFVDSIIKINNSDIDADKLAKNATNAIKGVAQAIVNCAPEILTAISIIIVGVMAILGAQQVKMALQAVAFVTSFIIGLASAMPLILTALDSMFNQIIDHMETDPEMTKRWEEGGHAIGSLIMHGIIGAFLGLTEAAAEALVYGLTSAKDWTDKNLLGGHISIQHVFSDKAMQEENEDELLDKVIELERLADKKLLGYDSSTKTAAEWDKIIDYINYTNESLQFMIDHGSDFSEESIEEWNEAIAGIKIPEDQMSRLINIYDKDKKALLNALTPTEEDMTRVTVNLEEAYGSGPQQEVKTMTRTIEDANTAITATGDSANDASTDVKDYGGSVESVLSDVANKAKTSGGEILTNITDGFNGFFGEGGMMSSFLGDISLTSGNKIDLKSLGVDIGDLMGISAGQAMDDDMQTHLDYWIDEANKIVNLGLWERTNGQQGYMWQSGVDDKGKAFASPDAWANYKWKQYTDSIDYAQESLYDYLGITEQAEESTYDFEEALESLGESADTSAEKLEDFRDSVRDSIAQAMHNIFDEVSEQEYIDPEEMLYRMEENTRRVGEWARNIATLAARGMSEGLLNELKDMGPAGAAKVQAFVDMTDEQLEMANRRWRAADFLPDYGTQEIEQAYRNAGFNASLGFSDGVDLAGVKETGIATGKAYDEGVREYLEIESPSQVMKEVGEYSTAGLAAGITDSKSTMLIKNQSMMLAKMLINNLQSQLKPDIFRQIGINVVQGLNNGLSLNMQIVLARVNTFASNILNSFQRVLRIKSPSKAMEEIGAYTMEGFGVGFEEGATDVEKLSEKSANDILNQMKEQIAAITNGWTEDNVYEPVIRPVFDMTSIDQGYNDIQSWFANAQGVNLNGSISRLTPTRNDDTLQNQMLLDAVKNINNDDVVAELGNLRNDISNLQSAITHMQVVMNTGALVGQIVDPLDNALGMKSLMNTRGRY